MSNKSNKDGFTLVEILVAMTIIVTIVSMLYGSYFATLKSVRVYKSRIALSQQGRKVLTQMAQQIRCSHAAYFNGNSGDTSGEILHLVTTSGIFRGQNQADGLFEVTYKFDKSRGLLSLSQERFVGVPEGVGRRRDWQPIVGNIEHLELAFFDGQQWLNKWDFKDKKKLPCAVRIEISYEDEDYQQCRYGTVAYVCCWKNQDKKTRPDVLVAVEKQ